MGFLNYFKQFCKKYGYLGIVKHNPTTKEYCFTIAKSTDNRTNTAELTMSKNELKSLSNTDIMQWLDKLHEGFKTEYNM